MKTAAAWLFVGLSGALLCTSCGGGASGTPAQTQVAPRYHCPMHPSFAQGRKGECPICGMDLVPVPAAKPAEAQAASRYHCPMHPSLAQDGEGECPICGMDLVPAPGAKPAERSPRAIAVAEDKQKVIGLAVTPVTLAERTRALRLLGRVAPDEARTYRINAGVGGSVRDLAPVTTGSRVKRGQVLGSFYGPEAYPIISLFIANIAGKEYVVRRQSEGSMEGEGVSLAYTNIQQRIMQLENIGVSARQREEIARTRKMPDTIEIVSPANGFVLARNVSPGTKFDRGEELFRIADLSRVWVLADVFLHDAAHVRAGMRAQVTIPEQQATLPATVATALPQFDPVTRTMKVKLEVANPGHALRPDMFVDVLLAVEHRPALVVPTDAVLDSGLAKTVFVESAPGRFEARRVETGASHDGQIEIVKGLSAGERVVTAGTFFLDSESRMRSSASGAAAANDAPVPTGHEHPDGGAGPSTGRAGARDEEAIHALAGSAR
ncbi:MAG TPA: efflux RND transporter periplasmic adaptor subunit [Anaeromyxobacter sp.]|nr:efflux RND transporter periplasmic adaptor subunit [Anaeromyxobacter sp.]